MAEETATLTCPACHARAPAGARYCPNCAASLAGAPTAGPRRAGLSGWVKALILAVIVAVVAAAAVIVLLVVGVHKATKNFSDAVTPRPGRPPGYHGPAYPGMIAQDHVAGSAGATVDFAGQTLTAGDLKRTSSFLGPTLCSPVTIINHSLTTANVGPADWKLQQPNGIVETFAITGTLQGGQIAPGGQAGGTVCFADSGQTGTFVLLWQPLLQLPRGVWLLHF